MCWCFLMIIECTSTLVVLISPRFNHFQCDFSEMRSSTDSFPREKNEAKSGNAKAEWWIQVSIGSLSSTFQVSKRSQTGNLTWGWRWLCVHGRWISHEVGSLNSSFNCDTTGFWNQPMLPGKAAKSKFKVTRYWHCRKFRNRLRRLVYSLDHV